LIFSISGGVDPYADTVELAFLDAYAAGVLVSASAGNDGPDAGTVNHNGPWVQTVAASTQSRTFRSTVTLGGGGATLGVSGATITAGIAGPPTECLAKGSFELAHPSSWIASRRVTRARATRASAARSEHPRTSPI